MINFIDAVTIEIANNKSLRASCPFLNELLTAYIYVLAAIDDLRLYVYVATKTTSDSSVDVHLLFM
jgi:hypothetical protein